MQFVWQGVFPALTTPFNQRDELDLVVFEKNINAQLEAGVHGLILAGSLGEASTLTMDEKQQLGEFTVSKLNKKVPVIMNIAEGSTSEAIHQAKAAKDWG